MMFRGIAQLVEYRSPKPWVAGSNPPAPAKNKKVDAAHRLFCFSLWFGGENLPAAKRRTGATFGVFAPQNAVVDRKTNLLRSEAKYGILLPLPRKKPNA